jgi:replication-associated recombination protein RarA
MSQIGLEFPIPLVDRYTPKRVSEFLCEKPRKIMSAFAANPFPSGWYFLGGSGLGKSEMAIILAREIGAERHHIPSRDCSLEVVNATCSRCWYVPMMPNKFHMIHVDEADGMSQAAQDAFLSKLDGTGAKPPNTVFVFTGNSVDGLERRFMSRVRLVEFSTYGLAAEMVKLLERVWAIETGGKLVAPNFKRVVKDANNNIRDAFMTLEVEMMSAEPVEQSQPAITLAGIEVQNG